MNMKSLMKCWMLAMCTLPPICTLPAMSSALAQDPPSLKLKSRPAVPSGKLAPWRAVEAPIPSGPVLHFPIYMTRSEDIHIPGSCEVSSAALCYDYRNGGAVYKPSRHLLPEISGMRRESVSLKRDKITFKYSFR